MRRGAFAVACAIAVPGAVGCALVAGLGGEYEALPADGASPDATGAVDAAEDPWTEPDAARDARPPGDAGIPPDCGTVGVLACESLANGCPAPPFVVNKAPGANVGVADGGALRVWTANGITPADCRYFVAPSVTASGFIYDFEIRVDALDMGPSAKADVAQIEARAGTTAFLYTLFIQGDSYRFVGGDAQHSFTYDISVKPSQALHQWRKVSIDVDFSNRQAHLTIGPTVANEPIGDGSPQIEVIDIGVDFLASTGAPWDIAYRNLSVRTK